jgi:hypothetical protein
MANRKLATARAPCVFCIRNEFADTWWRALIGIADILTHAAVAGVMVLSIWCFERAINSLWSGGEPVLFKGMGLFEIHLTWLFNATDVGLIFVFSLKSILIFWKLYTHRGHPV